MEFVLDKCGKATFTKGELEKSENIQLRDKAAIKAQEHHEAYKYLGEKNTIARSRRKLKPC